jgi:hypothetical protein
VFAAARQGNRHLRAAMTEAARATASPTARRRFRRLARRFGKSHENKAATVVLRTLICIAWAVSTNNRG